MKKHPILIVEDESQILELWESMLSIFDISIFTAHNAEEATKIIIDNPIKLLITDLQMPVKGGFYLLDFLKTNNINIETWLCSGQINIDEKVNDFKVDRIINKPFDMMQLSTEISELSKSW